MIWADGEILADGAPVFAATDRGAILGDGLFETIKCVSGTPLFAEAHLARMKAGAALLDLPFDEGLAREGLAAAARGAPPLAALRLTLTRGTGGRGLAPMPQAAQRPRLVVTSAPYALPGDAPVTLAEVSVRRNEHSPASQAKTLSYQDMILARGQAAGAGADDALVRNTAGRPVCTTIGNLFARTRRGFATPPPAEGILPGVVRGVLLSAAARGDVLIEERALTEDDLAGGLYRTNSLMGVQPCALPGQAPPRDNPLGLLYERAEKAALEGG